VHNGCASGSVQTFAFQTASSATLLASAPGRVAMEMVLGHVVNLPASDASLAANWTRIIFSNAAGVGAGAGGG